MSLFGSIRKFFRADAAPVAQPPATAPPSRRTRHDMRSMMGGAASGFSNASSGYGMPGYDPRLSSQFSTGYMTDELATDMWRGSMLTGKIVSLLPSEAIEPGWDITIQDDAVGAGGTPDPRDSAELVESVETRHRALGTEQIIRRACEWDRLFGGAAIWVGANDMLAQDWSEPLNLDAPNLRLNWLRVLRSRDLYPLAYYTDPNHPKHGEVAVWQLQPRTRGTVTMPAVQIHESRLHLFRGRRIVEDGTVLTQNQNSWEFGDGILLGIYGAIRRFEESLDNVELTMKANGEPVWQHEGLADILASEGGMADFESLIRAMEMATSVLRARVIGAGQSFTRAGAPLTGLADLVTKFENELSAISSTPRTKLFGESAGGLGSTGESQHGDWDETKATYRKENQTPAFEWITALILRTLGGLPKRWKVEGRKYRQLDAKQQAELTKLDADTDIALTAAGIITADIVQQRAIWRDRYQLTAAPPEADMTGAIPDDIRDPAAGADPADPAAQDPAAAAPEEQGPKLAELGLNGAQMAALGGVIKDVAAGTMPRESGSLMVQFALKVPADMAEKMMPAAGFKPAAVESGLEAPPVETPPPVDPPRTDASDRTMAELIKKLAPSGRCDECGKRLPLEVDHVDGRGWAPRDVSKQQRTDRYWQEHDDGVKLRALCRSCNARDGALNKQGKSGPAHRSDALEAPIDPVATVESVTPFQMRALAGEPRDALVATLEIALGVPAEMAERLIPQSPGPSGVDPDDDDEDEEDLEDLDEDEDLEDLDEDDEEEDDDLEDGEREDADDPDLVDPEEIEERDDCDNPIRGEGGLFDGCAPGEGGGSSASGAKASPSAKAASEKAAKDKPAKKLTPKQKAAAKAKAVRERAKAKIAKEKAKLKAKKTKERAKVKAVKEKARAKIKAAKEKAKAKIAAQKAKVTAKKEAASKKKEEAAKARSEKLRALAEKRTIDNEYKTAKQGRPGLTREEYVRQRNEHLAKSTEQYRSKTTKSTPGAAAEANRREQERLGTPEPAQAEKPAEPAEPPSRVTFKLPAPPAEHIPEGIETRDHEEAMRGVAASRKRWEGRLPEGKYSPERKPGMTHSSETFAKVRNDFAKKLSDEELDSALYYSFGGDAVVNRALRNGTLEAEHNAKLRSMSGKLDRIIAKHRVPEDTYVERGMSGAFAEKMAAALSEGDVFQETGYTSTASTTGFAGSLQFRIKIPKGSSAAPLPSRFPTEGEFLLPRGSKFKVGKIKKTGDITNIEVEVVQ